MRWREQRSKWVRAIADFPEALTHVPLPQGNEPPLKRFHQACALLARKMDVPVSDLESWMEDKAREIDASKDSKLPEDVVHGARLIVLYLSSDPENLKTIALREKSAIFLGQDEHGVEVNTNGETELRAVLAMRRAVQGRDHPDALKVSLMVGASLYMQERYDDAEVEAREALADYERVYGPDLPGQNGVRSLLALTLKFQQKYAEEEPVRRTLITAAEREKGPNDPLTAGRHFFLAECLHAQAKNEDAAVHATRALEIYRNQFKGAAKTSQDIQKTLDLLKQIQP
jgi:hypothetical protein